MSALGPEKAKEFLKKLDEKKLLDLCADILTLEGHSEIKITDGPGDGQRDVRSITPTGEKYLTQSKYHEDVSKAISAPEIGEVVSGMLRFGYKKGLFITTARITPQAKRDLLEGYPGFEVDFLEGWEIAKKVFGNLVLKAIWYDGVSLDKVSYTLVFPMVARDLETDKPLHILRHEHKNMHGGILAVDDTQAHLLLQRSTVSTSTLGEYRSPRVRTISELGSSQISLTEIILSGVIYLKDVDRIMQGVGYEIVNRIGGSFPSKHHFAVIVGQPCLTPLGGESSGARIQLDKHEPLVLVYHDGVIESELDWILPTRDDGWLLPNHPHVSQAEWIRWHNSRYDICLDITVTSQPSDPIRWVVEDQLRFMTKWWNESLFVLLPAILQDSWANTNLPEPSQWYRWYDEKSLGAWFHSYLNLPIQPMEIEPDDEPDDESEDEPLGPFPFGPDLEQIRSEQRSLLQKLESMGGTVVKPQEARHMIALVSEDPFPAEELVEYPGRYLTYEKNVIPSPIDPLSRKIRFTVCWLIRPTLANSLLFRSDLDTLTNRLSLQSYSPFEIAFTVDGDTLTKDTFLIADIDYMPSMGFEKTQLLLQKISQSLEMILLKLEDGLKSQFAIERATEKYWEQEIHLDFSHA